MSDEHAARIVAMAAELGLHALARPAGEGTTWCVCLTWSVDRGDRRDDERAYERHVAEALARRIASPGSGGD